MEYALARGDAAPAGRQTSQNGDGHPGRENGRPNGHYQRKDRMVRPASANQQTISTPAPISIPIQYATAHVPVVLQDADQVHGSCFR